MRRLRNLFEYIMPTSCKKAMAAALERNHRTCQNIVCLIDSSKEKIIHEMSTQNARPKSVHQFHSK